MTTYIIRRLMGALPLLIGVSIVVFSLLHLIPGGPLAVYLDNPFITGDQIALLKRQLGLDRPLHIQYLSWFGAFARGEWGASFSSGEQVAHLIAARVPATLTLMGSSLLLALAIAVPAGVYSAVRQYSSFDYSLTVFSFLSISMPVFWFGLMLQLLFSVRLRWLPVGGFGETGLLDMLHHLVLPAVVLSLFTSGRWSRFARSGILEVLRQDYVRTARAKGLANRVVVFRHALRNALLPLVTVAALDLASLFSGAVVTETVFAWPGMGSLLIQSVSSVDYPTLLAILMISSCTIITCNLVADVLYGLLDPRIVYR